MFKLQIDIVLMSLPLSSDSGEIMGNNLYYKLSYSYDVI